MSLEPLLAYSAAGAYSLLAVVVMLHRPDSPSRWFFLAGLLVFALEMLFAGLSLDATSAAEALRWQRWLLVPMAMIPGTWLPFSLCYARGNYREFLLKWRLVTVLLGLVPLLLVVGFNSSILAGIRFAEPGQWFLAFGWGGTALNVIMLLGSVLILMHLERTFRTAIGVMRWRIKFMVLGLTLVFGLTVYASSQGLLYSGIDSGLQKIYIYALLVATPLMAVALLRSRLTDADVYPSQAVLHHSLTALLAGLYLLITGVLAKIVAAYGGDTRFPLKSLVILIALVGLGVLLFSDRLRQRTALWVSRHFQRPLYDYRKAWSVFTERTTSLLDDTHLSRAVVKLVSETFNLLSVSIWLVDDQQRQLGMVASTILSPEAAPPLDLKDPHVMTLVSALTLKSDPIDLDQVDDNWGDILKQCDPDFFKKGGNRVCLPLVSFGEFLGLITIADRVSGFRFSLEGFDLLKCIGDQMAASLRNLRMTERLLQAKQMEAFQTMAAFFVHDLKNTASTLSLITQNMSAHFNDPAFRQDALRGLTRSVTHLNDLISRMTALRQSLQTDKIEADLNELVRHALSTLEGLPGIALSQDLQPLPKVVIDPEQIHKVITNLVLNAREAVAPKGEIHVATSQNNGWVVLSVADNGCGMSREFIARRLFKPFHTTKKQGLGIGMLHCKMIVDAHQGKIEVESEEGQGTRFRVLLPVQTETP